MTQETTPLSETTVVPETQPDKSAETTTGAKTFTEAEVQELVKKRLLQQSGSERSKLLAKLGIEDEDADAELLKQAKAKREADKTEVERLAGETAKEKERREKLEQEYADFKASVEAEKRAATRDNAVTKALTAANAKAEKVLKLLRVDQSADLDAVLKDDGTVDEKKVTALVDVARKAYPEDFGKGGVGSPSMNGGRGVDPNAAGKDKAQKDTRKTVRSNW